MYSRLIVPCVDAVRDPDDLDIAWTAGIYEGEGCADAPERKTRVQISQKDPEILFRIREMFGGSITEVRVGTPHYCHVLKINGDRARLMLQLIYPYMSVRRKKQIDRAAMGKFTGVVKNTRPVLAEDRKKSREFMTRKQQMVESQLHYKEKNSVMVKAYQREYARGARLRKKESEASQVIQ